ncbi:MAG: AgrD family cyclic lactone autoinducer peptide [Candidatus Fimenecus sp.]
MQTKSMKRVVLQSVKTAATEMLKHNANQTTCFGIYQPKAPEALKKFSKAENDK